MTGVRFPALIFLLATASRPALDAVASLLHPASHPTGGWGFTSTLPNVFMTWGLIKHGDDFSFNFFHSINLQEGNYEQIVRKLLDADTLPLA
jgi:hypothetical protein